MSKEVQVTLSLTERQAEFLKLFAAKQYHGADDNRCTGYPLHIVENKRYQYIPYTPENDSMFEDETLTFSTDDAYESWFDDEKETVEDWFECKEEECPIEIKSFKDLHYNYAKSVEGEKVFVMDYTDYFKVYGVKITGIAWKLPYWEKVAPFFILEEAKRYMEYQSHNLHKPRVYTYGAGYANNGEFTHFWELLMQAGNKLNKTENVGGSYV
ncbi:hypothetical protein ACOSZH_01270 [Priestia megaterium]|uniref:hypothetical protein n=1 Tax=Priestia megaterium TaxID=1404 RepID=UPI003B9FE48D